MKAGTILTGCGAGVVATLPYMWPLFSPYHYARYRSFHSLDSMIWGALIDLMVVSALAALLFFYLERKDRAYLSLIWAFVVARLASLAVQTLANSQWPALRHVRTSIPFVITLLIALALRWTRPRIYAGMAKGSAALLLLAGLSALWVVPELLYLGLRPKAPEPVLAASAPTHDTPTHYPNTQAGRRIVWLVFDELSYQQTFERRFPGLAMPAFDQLRSQSFLFQNVRPAAYYTERALPSLFLGQVVEDIRSDLDGQAILKLSGQDRWSALNQQSTIFGDARRNHWTTGIAGWWNPYCRILPNTLDSCYWTTEETNGIFSTENSALENAAAPFLSRINQHAPTVEQRHEASLQAMMEQAQTLITDEKIRFVFIHLPVPHPPGIYDRTTGKLRATGTYIDNLALADRSLGELIEELNTTPSAKNTTLIVCSDHSWRVPMWKSSDGWSAEEEAASRGKFDPRPVIMIRFPQQSHEVAVSGPFNQVALHGILVSMLQGSMNSPADLEAWLKTQ